MNRLIILNGKKAVYEMKKSILITFILIIPMYAFAQTKQYYLYNIVTFEGNFKKEGLKVNIDNGKSIEPLKNEKGKRIVFKTPASALMYFTSKGWKLFANGGTTEGAMINGIGGSSTTSYWIFRIPCTEEEFDKAVEDGIKK